MAVVAPSFTKLFGPDGGIEALVVQWGPIGDTDTATPVSIPWLADKSIQVEGTFASASIALKGSNDSTTGADGHFETLNDAFGTAIAISSAAIKQVTEITRWVMPVTSGGSGSSLTVTVLARRVKR